eukprot:6205719-Pleurochrysis_carterae.AAC.1
MCDALLTATPELTLLPNGEPILYAQGRGAARPTNGYEAKGFKTVCQAWQALAPYYHASNIYCRALPLNAASDRDDYGRAPATSGAHDYTVRREANSPLDHCVAMRFGVSTREREGTVQRRINVNANTCKCE